MRLRHPLFLSAALLLAIACGDNDDDMVDADDTAHDHGEGNDTASDGGGEDEAADEDGDDEVADRVGYEILEMRAEDEIIVWINQEAMTLEDFEALPLEAGWFRNQPREGEPDGGTFAMSPGAAEEGDFTVADHYGHPWMHNATVVAANQSVDEGGLLTANLVAKHHTVTWNAGRTLFVLTSPEGEHYVRVSRDAGRTLEVPTLPPDWSLAEQTIDAELSFELPNPTVNIRADNEDSFQGPVAAEVLGI